MHPSLVLTGRGPVFSSKPHGKPSESFGLFVANPAACEMHFGRCHWYSSTIGTKSTMKFANSIDELFLHNLKDVYNAEKQLLKALPKMARGATSRKLKAAFESHLKETEGQVQRLEKVFQTLGAAARGIKCAAMEGLIEEGGEVLQGEFTASVKDAALIAAANKVEHYEIASYGTLVSFARLLGHNAIEKLLNATLEEEKKADQKLTALAESEINVLAETAD